MVEDIFLAAKETGRQLAKDCRIPEEAQRAVSKEPMPQDAHYEVAHAMMEQLKKEMGK